MVLVDRSYVQTDILHAVQVTYQKKRLRDTLRIRDSQTDSKESLFPLIFMNSEELRNLYANLLAKSMYIDTKELVHPSFVEIIRQMSPIDALIFKTIMGRAVNPMINLIMKNEKGTFRTIVTNVTDINIAPQELIGVSIDNLTKQNLLSVPDDGFYSDEKVYDSILQTEFYEKQKYLNRRTVDGFEFTYTKKMRVFCIIGG